MQPGIHDQVRKRFRRIFFITACVLLLVVLAAVVLTPKEKRLPAELKLLGYQDWTNGTALARLSLNNHSFFPLRTAGGAGTNSIRSYQVVEETADGWFAQCGGFGSPGETIERHAESDFCIVIPADGRRRRLTFGFQELRPDPPAWIKWNWLREFSGRFLGMRAHQFPDIELVAGGPDISGLTRARLETGAVREQRRQAILEILDYGGFIHWDERGLVDRVSLEYNQHGTILIECGGTSDQVMTNVAVLHEVRNFILRGSQATDWAMQHVGTLTNLVDLHMVHAQVTDTGIAALTNLVHLERIHISGTGIGDPSLAVLSTLPNLRSVTLYDSHISDDGLVHLKSMTQLQRLSFGLGTGDITDRGMRHLRGLTNLLVLELHGTQVTDAGIATLTNLVKLEKLWLNFSLAATNGVAILKKQNPDLTVQR